MFAFDLLGGSRLPEYERQEGFTLIEVLAVLTILAIAGAILIPSISHPPEALTLEAGVRELSAGLRAARSEAIGTYRDTLITIDVRNRVARMLNGHELRFPISASMKVVAARQERFGEEIAGFRFFPDGTSTGGEVSVTLGQQRAAVQVNWISGAITSHLAVSERR